MSEPASIVKDNPLWEKLNEAWLSERKPGYVTFKGVIYRVISATDDDVQFHELPGGIDGGYYSSVSTQSPKR